MDKPTMLAHLRKSARVKNTADADMGGGGEAMLGIFWPSVLSPLLSFWKPDFVGKLLEGIEAVLVEVPDLPGEWQIYGRPEQKESLRKLGFAEISPDAAEAAMKG
jgi:hypothetical protein